LASRIPSEPLAGDFPVKSPIDIHRNKAARTMGDVHQRIDDIVKNNRVVLFMKGTAQFPMCGFSGRAIQILKACGVSDLKTVNVLEDEEVRQGIKGYSDWPTIPQLYVNGEFVGGSDIMTEMYQAGELQQALGLAA
jgi:monothiol glutaredoxin